MEILPLGVSESLYNETHVSRSGRLSCDDKRVIKLRCKEILHLLCSYWHTGIYIKLIVYEDVACVIATLTTKRRRKWRT